MLRVTGQRVLQPSWRVLDGQLAKTFSGSVYKPGSMGSKRPLPAIRPVFSAQGTVHTTSRVFATYSQPFTMPGKVRVTIPKSDPFRNEVDRKVIGHQTYQEIAGTSLEGSQCGVMPRHIRAFLDLLERSKGQILLSSSTIANMKNFLQSLHTVPESENEIPSFANMFVNKVRSLQAGESVSLEGGWLDEKEGHYILSTIRKKEDGSYDVFLWNRGAGIEKFHAHKTIREGIIQKRLVCPYVKFEGVEPERLGIHGDSVDSTFFRRIMEMTTGKFAHQKDVSVYASLIGFGSMVDKLALIDEQGLFIEPQISGTCTHAGLMARLMPECSCEEEYLLFEFSLYYSSLKVFFASRVDNAGEAEKIMLIKKQGEKLLRSLASLQHLMPKEEADEIEKDLFSMLEYAEEKQAVQIGVPQDPYILADAPKPLLQVSPGVDPYNPIEPTFQTLTLDSALLCDSLPLRELQIRLEKIQDIPLATLRQHAIERLARQLLGMTKEEFLQIPLRERPKLIHTMKDAIFTYVASMSNTYGQSEEVRNTILIFTKIAYDLALPLIPDLAKFPLYFVTLQENFHGDLEVCYKIEEKNIAKQFLLKDKPEFFFFNYDKVLIGDVSTYQELQFLMSVAYPTGGTNLSHSKMASLFFNADAFTTEEGKVLVSLRDMMHAGLLVSLIEKETGLMTIGSVDKNRLYRISDRALYDLLPSQYQLFENRWKRNEDEMSHLQKDFLPFKYLHSCCAENAAMTLPKKFRLKEKIPSHVTANGNLRTSKLLYFFSSRYIELQDPKVQELFFRHLFVWDPELSWDNVPHMTFDRGSERLARIGSDFIESPVIDIVRLPEVKRHFEQFLQKGKEFILKNNFAEKKDVLTLLFFARLARRVQDIDPSLQLPAFEQDLHLWLKFLDLTTEEQLLIHLHRIVQYRTLAFNELISAQKEDILESFFFIKDNAFSEKGDGIFQKEEALRYIFTWAPHVEEIAQKHLDNVLSRLFPEEYTPSSKSWIPLQYPSYTKGDWMVNLLTGDIYKNGKKVFFHVSLDLHNYPPIAELFPQQTLRLQPGHKGVYQFQDRKNGHAFRYVEKDKKKAFQIFYKNEWFEFAVNDSSIKFIENFYMAFGKGKERIFIHKKMHSIDYLLTENGVYTDFRTGRYLIKPTSVFSEFESESWQLWEKDRKTGRSSFHFPRVLTDGKREFSLVEQENGRITLAEGGRGYVLIPPVKNILGGFSGALYFKRPDADDIRILIPIRASARKKFGKPTFAPQNSLLFSDDFAEYPLAEYVYREGKVKSKDRKSQAFLAYLYTLQKKESDACIALDFLGRDIALTDSETNILSWICDSPNRTAAGKALSLKAFLFIYRNGEKKSIPDFEEIGKSLVDSYRFSYEDIPAEVRLTPYEMQELVIYRSKHLPSPVSGKVDRPQWPHVVIAKQKKYRTGYIRESTEKEFKDLYRRMWEAKTSAEKKFVLSSLPSSFELWPEDLKRIIYYMANGVSADNLVFQALNGPLPDISKAVDIPKFIEEVNTKIPDGKVSSIAPMGKQKNTDAYLLPVLSRLSVIQAIEQVTPPLSLEPSLENFPEKSPIDLQKTFLEPYFRSIEVRSSLPRETDLQVVIPRQVPKGYEACVRAAIQQSNEEIILGKELLESEKTFIMRAGKSREILSDIPEKITSDRQEEVRSSGGWKGIIEQRIKDIGIFKDLVTEETEELRQKLRKTLTVLEQDLLQEKEEILRLAKTEPKDPLQRKQKKRLEEGKALEKITFTRLVTEYLRGEYGDLNLFLHPEDVRKLDLRLRNFLLQATKAQQLQRALAASSPGEMGQILADPIAYPLTDSKESRVCLVFEYRENLRIREGQFRAISELIRRPDVILQMLMGGGKTAVLASVVLESLPKGSIPIFIAPKAQFSVQRKR